MLFYRQEEYAMIKSHKLKKRDRYLNKLIGFQDTEPVKVITGIRRCGKSSILKLMVAHLTETGIQPEQIVEMNFESNDFRKMTSDGVYAYVKERIVPRKRMYLLSSEYSTYLSGRCVEIRMLPLSFSEFLYFHE